MRAVLLAFCISLAVVISNVRAGCSVMRQAPLFKQCDGAWGMNKLGSSSTICSSGALISAIASGLNSLEKTLEGKVVTPAVLNDYLLRNNGYYGNLFIWASLTKYGLTYEGQSTIKPEIKQYICDTSLVFLNVNGGSHWVLANSWEGDTFYVNDSLYNKGTYSSCDITLAAVYSLS